MWACKRNKINVLERRDKSYLRNAFKLAYHYILSDIDNAFIVRHNKQRIYFKNIYKTDLCDCLKETQKEHTYTVDGLINGGGGAYIRVGLYP